MNPEKPITAKSLYLSTIDLASTIPAGYKAKPWDELTWDEKDHWQSFADEMNESRRSKNA